MSVELEVDEEEYRFADRYVAARSWAVTAALVERLPGMRAAQVVDETGTPLLIVHDVTEQHRVQLDMVAWVLFGPPSDLQHLYWDEVFATRLEDVVERIAAATGPVLDDGVEGRLTVYRFIAQALAVGLADDVGWWVQQVRIGQEWTAETVEVLREFEDGEDVAIAALDSALAGAEAVLFHEPLWVLRRGLEAVALLDTTTGSAHLPGGLSSTAGRFVRRSGAEMPPIGLILRHSCADQWACLDAGPVVDPAVDLAPLRYGHVRAEAWRLVAALVGRADLEVAGPGARGEICRMVDADGRVRLRMTSQGVHVEGSPTVRDWWDVFAAPLATTVADELLAELPRRAADAQGIDVVKRIHRFIARVLSAAVDDEEDWRVTLVDTGRWAVTQGDSLVAMLAEDGTQELRDQAWVAKADEAEALRVLRSL